jgi:hypothetical protein
MSEVLVGMSATYATVDFPAPPASDTPCGRCGGKGVTGERYEMTTDGPTLLVDVFCPDCGGCGNGDPEHRSCTPALHAWGDDDGWDEDEDPDVERCRSCDDRGWNAVDGFNDDEVVTVRVPCGCQTDRIRLL